MTVDLAKLRADMRLTLDLAGPEGDGVVHSPPHLIRALLDALDAAERERDEAKWLVDVGAGEMALLDLEVEKTKRERDEAREALQAIAQRASDPQGADWYWRDLEPDECGDSIHEALRYVGEGVVCSISSSFIGPKFFAAVVPTLNAEADDTEELIADTQDECVRLVKERQAAIRALKDRTP
jgi:hypothetical protein